MARHRIGWVGSRGHAVVSAKAAASLFAGVEPQIAQPFCLRGREESLARIAVVRYRRTRRTAAGWCRAGGGCRVRRLLIAGDCGPVPPSPFIFKDRVGW